MSTLRLFRVAANVTTLGFGRRAAVWVQGCTIGCPGCCSLETWDAGAGRDVPVASVLDWIAAQPGPIDGLTLSGGEPTEQADAVGELIAGFRRANPGADVLLFTGLRHEVARLRVPRLLDACDMVCAGPYVHSLPPLPLRGSSNQTLHPLTEIAHRRYADVDDWPISSQALVRPDGFLTVGIPDTAKLARIAADMAVDHPA